MPLVSLDAISPKFYPTLIFRLIHCVTELVFVFNFSLENVSFTSTEDDKQDYQEELLLDFPDEERSSIFKVIINVISYLKAFCHYQFNKLKIKCWIFRYRTILQF